MERGSKYRTKQAEQQTVVEVVKRERCACGYKVRGKNHVEGSHHKQGKK